MSDSYKVRVKHLIEENTVEASEGEMIISQVTGHISVKDKYFINSATKDIAARNSALNNFYENMATDINFLNKEAENFSKAVQRVNRIINNILNDDSEINSMKNEMANDESKLESNMSKLKKEVEDQYEYIHDNLDIELENTFKKYANIEKSIKELELMCREFQYMNNYIKNQKYIYYENYKELNETIAFNKENYEYVRKLYSDFNNEMKDKYESLVREFPEYNITFEGGVLNGPI